jgi:hypothetical protein
VAPGEWAVRQTKAPADHAPADQEAQSVTVGPGEAKDVTFVNARVEPSRFPAALARPDAVLVVGEVQGEPGCAQPDDPACTFGELAPGDDGVWSASLGPPASGTYALRLLVRTGDETVTLGADGRAKPAAPDIVLAISEDVKGLYVAWNRLTGAVTAVAFVNVGELQIDDGALLPLPPAPAGGFDGYLDVGSGPHTAQFFVDGQPMGEPIPFDGGEHGRVHVVLGIDGIPHVDPVTPASLTVRLADGDGNPVPNACFAVVGDGDRLLGQECDASDGDDGATAIRFPNGIEPGAYTVVQTGPVEGVPDQALDWAEEETERDLPVTAG